MLIDANLLNNDSSESITVLLAVLLAVLLVLALLRAPWSALWRVPG